MQKFKQNQTTGVYTRIYMFLADATDGYTPETSLVSATVNLFKNGVAFSSQPTTPATLTHIQSGHWYYQIDSSYLTDLGILTVTVQDTNIRPVVLMAEIVTYDPTTSTGITAADVWAYATRDLTAGVAVSSIANNAITAASINADAITAAKIADSAITIRLSTDGTASEGRIVAGTVAADTWNALVSSYTTANTFGARVIRARSTSPSNEAFITGANHIAADIHELQPNVITAAGINTGAIDADALATDAVTEIVNAVMTVDPSTFPGTSSGYWLYEAGLNSQQLLSDTNYINSTLYVESIADALLNRNIAGGSNAGRLVKEALYALRNKSEISGSTLNVYNATDGAIAWTAAVSSSASADPVTGIDPV